MFLLIFIIRIHRGVAQGLERLLWELPRVDSVTLMISSKYRNSFKLQKIFDLYGSVPIGVNLHLSWQKSGNS